MRKSRGFTMIEVLVTMVVISFGLLGVAGIIANGLKNNLSSYGRSQASWLANDIIDRMRANRVTADVAGSPYNLDVNAATPGSTANIPLSDLVTWRNELAAALTGGTGGVDVDFPNRKVVVTIRWNDTRATGGSATQQFVVETRL